MKFSTIVSSLGGLVLVNADCISDCESTAASDLSCDVSDVSGCLCQADFATSAKACLYENSDCGKTYVASFYESWESACAGATTTAAATSANTASATNSATTSASTDCVASCESTAASDLGCNVSDVSGCFCLDDFATKAKSCLYESGCESDISTFYSAYESTCAGVSASSAGATAAAASNAAASTAAATSAAATFATSSAPTQAANNTTTSTTPVIVNGASSQHVSFGLGAVAAWLGVAALY